MISDGQFSVDHVTFYADLSFPKFMLLAHFYSFVFAKSFRHEHSNTTGKEKARKILINYEWCSCRGILSISSRRQNFPSLIHCSIISRLVARRYSMLVIFLQNFCGICKSDNSKLYFQQLSGLFVFPIFVPLPTQLRIHISVLFAPIYRTTNIT